jgi:PEP-CTERM motif
LNETTGVASIGASLTGSTSAFFALAPNPIPLISPVPEPETWALLLAGVVFVGRASRRKSVPGREGHWQTSPAGQFC